jgi:ubiquinone/menaquinone biosynthesis C-methylase UbiE
MANWLQRRKKTFNQRRVYCNNGRVPFFNLVVDFLPIKKEETIIDIGSGDGEFVRRLDLANKYPNCYLLDSNSDTVGELKQKYKNVIQYKIPETLMFEDRSVSLIHCSHVIEHLYFEQFYSFLFEIDRVLKNDGILVISAPLISTNFYHDLSHVRPYYPETILKYLSFKSSNYSNKKISNKYSVEKLIYRYHKKDYMEEGLGCEHFLLDTFIHSCKHLLTIFGISNYIKNGFTLILKKNVI